MQLYEIKNEIVTHFNYLTLIILIQYNLEPKQVFLRFWTNHYADFFEFFLGK